MIFLKSNLDCFWIHDQSKNSSTSTYFALIHNNTPKCTAGVSLQAELGQPSLEAKAWQLAFNLDLKMLYSNSGYYLFKKEDS